ncbi:MAG: hypothetical protein SGBAC_010370 [Bacillariaceae sp.]
MEDATPTESASDATAESTSAAAPPPHHKINIRQVKQKTLALLTELYRTETGDVKRMAMSLLQTLYTIEDHQVAEMNGKIQKLMMLIEEQKREQAELEEASLAGSHDSLSVGMEGGPRSRSRSRSLTEESNISQKVVLGSPASVSTAEETSENKDDSSSTESQQSSEKLEENNLVKRWQEKLGNFRKAEPKKETDDVDTTCINITTNNVQNNWREKIGNFRKAEPKKDTDDVTATNDDDDNNDNNNNNNDDVQQNNWRESMSTKMDASRERVAKGWRESTTKLQQGWKEQQEKRNNNKMAMMMTVDATKTEDTADAGSVSTEGSSSPSSPVGSEANPASASKDGDDLLHVIRNVVKNGVDSKKSRESLELALNLRREKARSRWAETRAKWKWPTRPATSAAQAQEAS